MKYTLTEITKKIEELPYEQKKAILEAHIDKTVSEIANKYGLHIDTTEELYETVNNFMLGMIKPDEFKQSIESISGIPKDKINELTSDINEQIFKKIRENTQKIQGEEIDMSVLDEEIDDSDLKEIDISHLLKDPNDDGSEKIVFDQSESDILKKAGVVVSDGPQMTPDTTEKLNRNEVISGVENPPEAKIYKLNVVESKLSAPQFSPSEYTDHTLKNITPQTIAITKPKVDPYRETI